MLKKEKKRWAQRSGRGRKTKAGFDTCQIIDFAWVFDQCTCMCACLHGRVCVCVRLLVFVGHKSMRRAVAFTLGLARSCGGSMQQVRCQSAGRVDVTTLKSRTPHSNITQRNPPAFVVSLLCLFVSATLLYSLLLWLHSIALCCSALWGSHIAGAFVGVSHCDDLMWAVREHQIVSI